MSPFGQLVGADALDAAESAFAAGDTATAREAIEDLLRVGLESPALVARARNDLAVIAVASGDQGAARVHAMEALAVDRHYAPALETLARCSEAEGDAVQAAHWFRRALANDSGDRSLLHALVDAEERRGRFAAAADALRLTGGLDADGAARLARLERRAASAPASAPPSGRPGRALVCVDFFHPSVGGSEMLAEQVALHLRALGWYVEVATRALPSRRRLTHRGLRIREIRARPVDELGALVDAEGFDAVLAFSDPRAWPVPAVCSLASGPRRVVVPCINQGNLGYVLASRERTEAYRALLARADAVAHSSIGGLDAKLVEALGITSTYVPNGAGQLDGAPWLRAEAEVPNGRPLVLVVGNLWPEKNHAGLLRALEGHAGDWRLALVGGAAPGADALAAEVRALAAHDERVLIMGRQSPSRVAAAMREADVLLLPSLAEATPLVLVEAMSNGLPWIATPTCGSAHDHAGGLILPVRDMSAGLGFLIECAEARAALGRAGRAHWQTSYRWETVAARYDALLRGGGPLPALQAPSDALRATDAVRAAQFDALISAV